jgi:hypothetical protein
MKPRLLLATLLAFEAIGLTATVGGDPSSNLFNAIRNGDTVAVRALAVRNINTTNATGETPLMYATGQALYALRTAGDSTLRILCTAAARSI